MHRILCIPRKLLETCRLRVRFCPAGIGRRLQRGGKQQKRRLAKSLTGHDCRDRHNSIGADYAESVHNSGDTFRLRVILAVTCFGICTVAVAKIISIGRRKQLPLWVFVAGIVCFVAVAVGRFLVPSAQASILIALTLSCVPLLTVGLRGCFGRRSSSMRIATSPSARLECVQEGSFAAADRAA